MRNSTSGIYVVIAELPQAMDIPVGQRRKDHFENGFYAYVGSALNGLEKRLARHLGDRKSLHWHIDYLLHEASVREIIYAQTNQKLECLIAYSLFIARRGAFLFNGMRVKAILSVNVESIPPSAMIVEFASTLRVGSLLSRSVG